MTHCSTFSRLAPECKRPKYKPPIYTETCKVDIQVIIKYNQNVFTLIACKEDTFQKIKIIIKERFNLLNLDFNLMYNEVIVNSLLKLEDYCIDTKNTRYTLTVRE
jgi:hypothetical protein